MPDPWSVVSTKPAGSMPPPPPPASSTSSDPWAVVSHQSAQPVDSDNPAGAPFSMDAVSNYAKNAAAVFGFTPETYQAAKDKTAGMNPVQEALSATSPHPVDMATSAARAVGSELQKGSQEGKESFDALSQGNVRGFLAHQIGQLGHAGATLAAPVFGENLSKAGEQFGAGDISGGLGTTTGVLAPVVAGGLMQKTGPIDRTISTPEEPAIAPRGITSSSFVPDLKAKVSAVGKLAGQDLLTHVPVLGRAVRRPSFVDYLDAIKTKADPQLDLFNKTPKLGDSPLFSTAADPLTPASLKPEEPVPAPYRLKGNQIQDATTVTPKQIIGPERQLAAAPDVPAPAPRGITQGKAPYVPGAAMEPAPFLTMHGAESGETAALMQLTHTGGQALRRIAQARGLKIPAASDNVSIIQKIHDDLSPEEIQSFGDAANARAQERATSLQGVDPAIVNDNRAIAQKLYSKADEMQAAGESPYKIRAWRTAGESIETRPTPVKDILGNVDALKTIRGVDGRMAQHIQEVTGSAQPVIATVPQVTPAGLPQAAPTTAVPQRGITQPVPPVTSEGVMTNESDLVSQMQRQIEANKVKRGITQPQAAVADRRLNPAQRQKVADMSPEERAQALLTSDKTGLPNRRAFDEAEPAQAVAMSDADGLKALNDKYGYEAGDAMLKAKADALKEAGIEAYHDKGDEFLYRGDSPADLQAKLDKARETLRNKTISVEMHDGRVLKFKGADFSYGTGQDLSTAETGLKANKAQREAAGQRARGQLRGITIVK